MKVILRGGPLENDGKEMEIEGGSYIIVPVAYKTPSFRGRKICDRFGCPERGKHEYDDYQSIFRRKYEIVYTTNDKGELCREAHYRGEE